MVLTNLRNRFCSICHRRGEKVGIKNLMELKDKQLATNLNNHFDKNIELYDIICQKHLKNYQNYVRKDDPLLISQAISNVPTHPTDVNELRMETESS